MNCCQCQGIEELFNGKAVAEELANYRQKGPDKTTRMLVNAIKAASIQGQTLLDVGGGVGAIQHALFAAGLETATDVDASQAYLRAAQEEAQRRGIKDRIHFQHGNFIDIADQIAPADIVTLDRVLCCFPDMENLVSLSAARAGQVYGLVYPRDNWWVKAGSAILNFFMKLQKRPFRTFIHSSREVDALASRQGLKRQSYQHTLVWQVVVYRR